jgi:hypothetical protein
MKKSTYKKALYNQALPHIAAQFEADKDLDKFRASVWDMIEKADRAWKAVKEPVWVDSGEGSFGEMVENAIAKEEITRAKSRIAEIVKECLSFETVEKDWSTATLDDVPVDWLAIGLKNCYVCKDREVIKLGPKTEWWRDDLEAIRNEYGRMFPTKRLAEMYLETLRWEPKERWKPDYGKRYFVITAFGRVQTRSWEEDDLDYDCSMFGNCFRTESEAQSAAEKVKALLLSL